MPPLHAGQLRYHDFTLYLEAREQRRLRQKLSVVQPLLSSPLSLSNNNFQLPFSTTNRFFGGLTRQIGNNYTINYNTSSSNYRFTYGIGGNHNNNTTATHLNYLNTPSSSTLLSPLQQPFSQQTRRPFLTSLRQDLHLKQLERIANTTPSDPNTQFEFLSQLSQTYPDAVIERFEQYKEFAIDERIVLLYLNCLQRTGMVNNRFGMKRFMDRIGAGSQNNNSMVSMGTIEALKELSKEKLGKGEMASRAAAVVAAGGSGGGGMMPGSHFGGVGGAAGGGGMFGARGTSPNSPLFIQTHNPKSTRDMLFAVVRTVAVAFVLVSALTVVFTESGLGRGGMGAMGNGKHIQEAEGSDVRFDDVKGVTEAKNELEEIVLYLKDPDRFTRLGGKLPRGLLLTGPPGTGKTLLAKAIAGEAGVPFFFASGSQFEEVYVGLGAKRIRELFEAAKQKSPSIIFIDEIDAVGGTRKLKDQSALKQTLNELLVQMDGFDENSGIIVIGATNFAESLDSALLRPGRFDKHVAVPLPDVGGRKEILEMYAAKTKVAEDVDLGILARGTTGFSGADLYNLMNQAAVKASVDGLEAITMQVFEWAKDKILMGAERKSAVITKETAKCTAYHEAGHALVGVLTDGSDTIHKATIMPRGQALGMVMTLPEGDQTSMSYKQMIARMDVCMGGRVAEELIFGEENVTSGASSDIQMATRIARAMVTKYGFSDDCGVVYYGGETGQSDASASTRAKIDEEVKRLTSAAYERATVLLKKHSKEHKLLAETLLEYETLTGDEVRELILKGKKPKRPVVNTTGGGRGDQALVAKSKKEGKSRLAGLADKIRGGKKEDAQ
eukprot:CAMPEP_0113388150 /NCGR_PEP_ID=MMETSP0013_2-20120614/8928_1 /TAXON_ID=2843 ORGANISM="Skeletonema costatum, Strain 1716" /NCGR_SAMPLE_ID=MMETSP0013_2 /ASSEMBLY_ACC=CAM_ASM_000158 /LENGTH=836 /DNA_ID=CAMNT_0000271117 /DNA_START=111 /DNA_END=2621 /DNA_ORIENTATION=- /assembly_acc=CAM_ASM_000158